MTVRKYDKAADPFQCFLTLPAITYQIVVPMWSRAWRFANVYAYTAIDAIFTILWLAGFISVAIWQSEGVNTGEKAGGSCSHFAYGSVSRCQTAQATTGFGILIFLLFVATTFLSSKAVLAYRRTGIMPTAPTRAYGPVDDSEAAKDVWSVNVDEVGPG